MSSKPLVVYLDQNKWIDLSRAYYRLPNGARFKTALECIKNGINDRSAVFPLSSAHLIETRKTKDVARRERLAQVMVEFSQGWTLASGRFLVPQELEEALERLFGNTRSTKSISALGRGIIFALGHSDDFQTNLGISPARARLLQKAIDTPNGLRLFLIGNDENLNAIGVTEFEKNATTFAGKVEISRIAGKKYSRAVRKRAYVADLTYQLQPTIARLMSRFGKDFGDFLALGKEQLMAFFESTPILNTEIELATERDEHWDRQVDPNDLTDVSFLSIAIPHCDIVVTERLWANFAKRKKLDQKYGTVILADLSELEHHLLVKRAGYR